jgi:hypothetical protein
MTINTILILAAVAIVNVNIQPEMQTRKHPMVEFMPSQVYVLCADQCESPTPKKKKTVIRRDVKQEHGFTRAKNFESVSAYLKERQTSGATQQAVIKKEHAIKKTESSVPRVKFIPKGEKAEKPDEPAKNTSTATTETSRNEGTESRNFATGTKGSMTGALTILFDFNSSIVTEGEKAKLLVWMEQIGDDAVYYEISGFTCPVHKEQRAVNLSINRAETIRGIIKGKKKRVVVTTKGMGTGQAYDMNDLRQNRRAEIKAFAANGAPVFPAGSKINDEQEGSR